MENEQEPRLPELMNVNELMAALGIGRTTLYSLAKEDKLPIPTIRLGRKLMFSRRALEAVLDGKRPRSISTTE